MLARIWSGPDAVQVGLQLAATMANPLDGIGDAFALEQLRLATLEGFEHRAASSAASRGHASTFDSTCPAVAHVCDRVS